MNTTDINLQSDITTLKRLINIPIEPQSAKWMHSKLTNKTEQPPGPEDWGVLVLLSFDSASLEQILSKKKSQTSIGIPVTFPLSLLLEKKERFSLDSSEQYYLYNGELRDASLFYKEPLLNGAVYVIDDETVLIYLYTQ